MYVTGLSICFYAGPPCRSQASEGRAGEEGVRRAPMEDVPRQGEAGGHEVRTLRFRMPFSLQSHPDPTYARNLKSLSLSIITIWRYLRRLVASVVEARSVSNSIVTSADHLRCPQATVAADDGAAAGLQAGRHRHGEEDRAPLGSRGSPGCQASLGVRGLNARALV